MFSPANSSLAASLIFGEPGWFWALLLLPVLILWFVRAERRAGEKLARILSPRLRTQLTDGIQPGRRRLRYGLLLTGLSLLIVAAARPQLGFDSLEVKRRGLDLIIGIDTSKSMLATDVEPNRLTRAKLAAQDLIALSQGDRLGLIAFAGRAFLQAPLTIDYGAVVSSVQDLDTDSVPRGGTNIAEAIQLALDAFGKGEGADRALILMTDGEELEADAMAMAKKAEAAGVKIFTLGIGSAEGSLLPLPGGGFVRDRAGQMVRSKLDEARLREIASITGGQYARLSAGPEAINDLYRDGIAQLKRKDLEMKTTQRPIERYAWPLSLALLFIGLGTLLRERKRTVRAFGAAQKSARRAIAVSAVALGALVATSGAFAESVETNPREAMRQYREGNYGEAESSFESLGRRHPNSARYQFNLGAAAYKRGEYARAAEAFGRALAMPDSSLHATTFYNLGNTLYQQGLTQQDHKAKVRDWENAIAHYDNALRLNPGDQSAQANRDFVKRALEEEKRKQPQQQKGGGDDKSKSSKSDQQKSKDKDKNKKDQDKSKDSSKQDSSQDSQKSDEQSKDDKSSKPQSDDSNSMPEKNDPQSDENRPPPGDEQKDQNSSGDQSDANSEQRSGRDAQPPPAPNQENRPQGDFQTRDQQPPEQKEMAEAAEAKDDGGGKLTADQARQLLEALKGEDDKIFLSDKLRRQESTYKDW